MKAAVVSEQGVRATMEDTHYLDLAFGGEGWVYGGVYDGHGGGLAARYAADNLHKVFLHEYRAGLPPEQAFARSYQAMSDALANQESGAAAVDFFVRDGRVWTANAGDSRVVVVGTNEVRQLTTDHRLDDAAERARVLAAGASIQYPYVMLGQRGLMTTRAIGDRYFQPAGVISIPAVNQYAKAEGDLFLICASDGLWDIISNVEVADIARECRSPDDLVAVLKDEALVKRSSWDNVTIIALSFQ